MEKGTAVVIIDLLIMLIGVVTIIIAIKSPLKLLRIKEDKLQIDNKEAFGNKLKILYSIFGVICIVISALNLFNIISKTIITIFLILAVILSNGINAIMLSKVIKKN